MNILKRQKTLEQMLDEALTFRTKQITVKHIEPRNRLAVIRDDGQTMVVYLPEPGEIVLKDIDLTNCPF